MKINYKINSPITTDQFIELLDNSMLGKRRPIDDIKCIEGMLANSNLTVTAWDYSYQGNKKLVGIARCMTDFHYACYLSGLAVSETHQKKGIGKQLQILVQKQLGPRCKLVLISVPTANQYYQHLGFSNNQHCWVLKPESSIN